MCEGESENESESESEHGWLTGVGYTPWSPRVTVWVIAKVPFPH